MLDIIVNAIIAAVNAIIAAIGSLLSAAISVLPEMPDLPDIPDPIITAAGWVAWFWPVSTTIDVLTFVLSMWLIWQLVALLLRWVKANNDT